MKRYIILFNNGALVQQVGLNMTYLQLHSLNIIKLIIDTKEGMVLTSEKWEWKKIDEYHDSSLVSDMKIKI